jgi:hypothetical protein
MGEMAPLEAVARAIFFRGGEEDDEQWAVMKRQGERNRHYVLANEQARASLLALRPALRDLVDRVWQAAMEDQSVPDTAWADRMIDAALSEKGEG